MYAKTDGHGRVNGSMDHRWTGRVFDSAEVLGFALIIPGMLITYEIF